MHTFVNTVLITLKKTITNQFGGGFNEAFYELVEGFAQFNLNSVQLGVGQQRNVGHVTVRTEACRTEHAQLVYYDHVTPLVV